MYIIWIMAAFQVCLFTDENNIIENNITEIYLIVFVYRHLCNNNNVYMAE